MTSISNKFLKSLFFLLITIGVYGQSVPVDEIACEYFISRSPGKVFCEAYSLIQDLSDYIDYSTDFVNRLKEGKKPKNPPSKLIGSGALKERLKMNKDLITSINVKGQISKFGYPLILLDLSLPKKINERREYIHISITELIEIENDIEEFNRILEDHEKYLAFNIETFKHLDEIIEMLIDTYNSFGGPFNNITNVYGYTAIDLKLNVQNDVAKISRLLSDNIKILKPFIAENEKKIELIKSKIELEFLDFEKNDLQNKRDSLIGLTNKYQNEYNGIIFKKNQLEKLGEFIKKTEVRLEERRKEILKMRIKHENSKNKYNKGLKDLKEQENKFYNMVYTLCPNNKPYEQCSHQKEKSRYTNRRSKLKEEIDQNIVGLNKLYNSVNKLQTSISNSENEWRVAFKKFIEEEKEWQLEKSIVFTRIEELQKISRELLDSILETNQLFNKNRADIDRLTYSQLYLE